MCISFTVKYLCSCIYEEWYSACVVYGDDMRPRPPRTWCYLRHIKETIDPFTLCETCLAKLEARVRRDGLRKTLQSAETFPLAAQLGMLIVLENDEELQKKYFGWKKRVFIFDREHYVPVTDGPVNGVRLREKWVFLCLLFCEIMLIFCDRGPRRRIGKDAWKYKSWKRRW